MEYENDYTYFENRECKYYPCHKGTDHINCLFCFCPLYGLEHCPGKPSYIEKEDGTRIKDCSGCTFSHTKENYEIVIDFLRHRRA